MNRPRAWNFMAGVTGTTTGKIFSGQWSNVGKAMVQAVVKGTGAVAADVLVYGSNDGVNWQLINTIVLTDTTVDSDTLGIDYPWMFIRADADNITGTGAAVTVTMAV